MEKLTKYEKRLIDIALWGMLAAFVVGADVSNAHEGYHAPREPRKQSTSRAPINARLPPGGYYESRQRGRRGDYQRGNMHNMDQPTQKDIKSMIRQILIDEMSR